MNIFFSFDGDGFPTGFYNEDVHGKKFVDGEVNPDCKIPDDTVAITFEQWQDMLANQGLRRWDGEKVVVYTPPSAPFDLVSYAADKRWQKETGGFELNGLHIATDDRSKLMLSGARVAAEADPNFTTSWKSADGAFVMLNALQIIAISNAVLSHVSDCFAIEAQVLSQIDDGTITGQSQVDTAFA